MSVPKKIGFLILLVAVGTLFLLRETIGPYAGFEGQTFVDIPHGASTPEIAELLQKAGVIRHAWAFEFAKFSRQLRRGVVLKAGEYRFDRPASVETVLDRLARGDVFYYELVVPEGKNMFEIAGLAAKFGLFTPQQFLAAARNPVLIRDLDPQAPTLEGYLFPSTYRLDRHTTPEGLCRKMTSKFREVWAALHTQADVHQTVTLASMVEKEGKLPQDRPLIAAVFRKRLSLGMKLDCDPTTIYAAELEGRYDGTLHKADLASTNPYNTYQHAGLPPGPIANPGLASLQAVVHPPDVDYLYFVLKPDGSGGHTFSRTLAEQSAAVAQYRRGLQR